MGTNKNYDLVLKTNFVSSLLHLVTVAKMNSEAWIEILVLVLFCFLRVLWGCSASEAAAGVQESLLVQSEECVCADSCVMLFCGCLAVLYCLGLHTCLQPGPETVVGPQHTQTHTHTRTQTHIFTYRMDRLQGMRKPSAAETRLHTNIGILLAFTGTRLFTSGHYAHTHVHTLYTAGGHWRTCGSCWIKQAKSRKKAEVVKDCYPISFFHLDVFLSLKSSPKNINK